MKPVGGHMARGYFLANKRSLNDALWKLRSPTQYLSKMPHLPQGSREKIADVSSFCSMCYRIYRILADFHSKLPRQIGQNFRLGPPFFTIFGHNVANT